MLSTNIEQTHRKLFHDRIDDRTPSHHQISTPNLRLLVRQQSVKSSAKAENHYREFQHALNMLKASVEELCRLELAQLRTHESTSSNTSNITLNLQVPSIQTCRSILPMASETIQLENKGKSSVHSPISLQPTPTTSIQENVSSKLNIQKSVLPSNSQSISDKWKSAQSLFPMNKRRRQDKSGENFTKYWTKTSLLHLNFRCLKHMH